MSCLFWIWRPKSFHTFWKFSSTIYQNKLLPSPSLLHLVCLLFLYYTFWWSQYLYNGTTDVTIQSNKIVLNEFEDNYVLLEPVWRRRMNFLANPIQYTDGLLTTSNTSENFLLTTTSESFGKRRYKVSPHKVQIYKQEVACLGFPLK